MLLVYTVVIIPLFFGPYYAYIRTPDVSFTFALFLAIVVRLPYHHMLDSHLHHILDIELCMHCHFSTMHIVLLALADAAVTLSVSPL